MAAEKARKAEAAEANRKRQASATPVIDPPDAKRVKLEQDVPPAAPAGFDFSALPATLVTDLIVANLQAFTENALIGLVQAYRHKKATVTNAIPGLSPTPPPAGPSRATPVEHPTSTPPPTAPRVPPSEPRADRDRKPKSASPPPPAPVVVKQEPVDPLKMDIDDEEIEYEPDKLNLEVCVIMVVISIPHSATQTDVWRRGGRRGCRSSIRARHGCR